MPKYRLLNCMVDFPFDMYEEQRQYIFGLLQGVQSTANCLLESPTGTGKTLSLLCGISSWLKKSKLAAGSQRCLVPKVFFTSRTHSQLSQAVKQYRLTSYAKDKKLNTLVLGGRDQLCLNTAVQSESSSFKKNLMCRMKLKDSSCSYGVKFINTMRNENKLPKLDDHVVDIEDLRNFGHKGHVCPYLSSRMMIETSDIIFMPYNYLIDAQTRKQFEPYLKGAIVIIDEGHNIEGICEDTLTTKISDYDLLISIKELNRLGQTLTLTLSEQPIEEPIEGGKVKEKGQEGPSITQVASLRLFLSDFLEFIENSTITTKQSSDPKMFMSLVSFLRENQHCPLTFQNHQSFCIGIQNIIDDAANNELEDHSKLGYLAKIMEFVRNLFVVDLGPACFGGLYNGRPIQSHFQTCVEKSDNDGKCLILYCLNAGLAFSLLNRIIKPHSIVITSGTLSPLDRFADNLDCEFAIKLSTGHVISTDQIGVSIVCRSPISCDSGGFPLTTKYNVRCNADDTRWADAYGHALVRIFASVPRGGGVLVCFPSYAVMEQCVKIWRTNRAGFLHRQMTALREVFVELRSGASIQLNEVMKNFHAKLKDGVALFMVCKGKYSEGLDFKGAACRAVVLIGIPYPSIASTKVRLKMNEYPEYFRHDTIRTINQCIGRVVRDKHDFGVAILLDERYPEFMNDLPKWTSPRRHDTFDTFQQQLDKFFCNSSKYPLNESINSPILSDNKCMNRGRTSSNNSKVSNRPSNAGSSSQTLSSADMSLIQSYGESSASTALMPAKKDKENDAKVISSIRLAEKLTKTPTCTASIGSKRKNPFAK